ncbi:heterodisulfide reductase-related iron-sulfur binding cluster [Thermosynechococcaceae cyanobacterium BACA0444]|uniref:Glycolate oxidase iron-sulfur subunit n=1 Tax=Pseudocalidococcus azoricus BACA0444 TaxID=2918990 RepID=A0AAE4FNU3_9CYAN|nr:heterodisulfide reductase-related iron-sulfur binding cluster [Pseudocalidococcus azoricus]MDS3859519.1 heterodisulfide reductase-related iron-sulfur binding cluster [Pseudocalidococcus azoricus BACA0444]
MSESPASLPGSATAYPPFLGFDNQSPPDPQLIDTCVHCGFCLATCPSYRVIGKETDSPRGRIYLMDGVNTAQIPLSPATVQHFDSCLGCLACVTTCPSGVAYDQLIAATRPQVERNHKRPLGEQLLRTLIFTTFPYPQRLRALLAPLWLYQKTGLQTLWRRSPLAKLLPKSLGAMEKMLPPIPAQAWQDQFPTVIPAQGEKRFRVGFILGCVQRIFLPEVNAATVRVLTANGCEVVIPPSQGCCAALSHHQGQEAQAQALARQMIDTFALWDLDAVIINASGCGHTLKEYGQLLAEDPDYATPAKAFASKVKDVQEFLANVGLTAPLHPLQEESLTLVYQDACHMIHGQKISLQPRQLLRKIPGVILREPIDAALCCGSAGVYNIFQPDVAAELGRQKVKNLAQTKAEVIVSANVGCTLQIRQYLPEQGHTTPVYHPMQLLDWSIRQEHIPEN